MDFWSSVVSHASHEFLEPSFSAVFGVALELLFVEIGEDPFIAFSGGFEREFLFDLFQQEDLQGNGLFLGDVDNGAQGTLGVSDFRHWRRRVEKMLFFAFETLLNTERIYDSDYGT